MSLYERWRDKFCPELYDQDAPYPPLELLEWLAEMELFANGYSDEIAITIAADMAARAMTP